MVQVKLSVAFIPAAASIAPIIALPVPGPDLTQGQHNAVKISQTRRSIF